MKRIICLISILASGLLLASCSSGIVNEIIVPTSTTNYLVTTTSDTTTTTNTPLVINSKTDLLKSTMDITYPDSVEMNNYIAGDNEYLWTNDDNTPVFGHHAGDVMCVEIYNSHNQNAVFSIQYADIPAPDTFGGGTTLYQPEPEAVNWVTIKYPNINVEAHQLIGIPITLNVPVSTQLPPYWEFRITVTDDTFSGQYYTNTQVRFLVSTMQPQ